MPYDFHGRPHCVSSRVGKVPHSPRDEKPVHPVDHASLIPTSAYLRILTSNIPADLANGRSSLTTTSAFHQCFQFNSTSNVEWRSTTTGHHQRQPLLIRWDSRGVSYGKKVGRDGGHDLSDPWGPYPTQEEFAT